jgi:uncharacterized membrane protein
MPTSPLWLMVLFVGLGLFQVGISVPLMQRRVKRNPFYGIRLPKTMRDDKIWYDANEYGGRQLFGAGWASAVLVFVAYLIPAIRNNMMGFTPVCLVVFVIPLAVALNRTLKYAAQL